MFVLLTNMQAIESEAVMGRFCSVYERLSQALENIPYDDLGISDEEKEQVRFISFIVFSGVAVCSAKGLSETVSLPSQR